MKQSVRRCLKPTLQQNTQDEKDDLCVKPKEMLHGLSRQVVAQWVFRRTVDELEHRNTQLRPSRDELGTLCRVLEGQRDLIDHDLQRAEFRGLIDILRSGMEAIT